MGTNRYRIKKRLARLQLFIKLFLGLIVCASPSILPAQELTQNAVSNGAAAVAGGNYTGFVSAGQMATYMYANGTQIATQGIILNEISGNVEFTFELNGTLTQNNALKSGVLRMKSAAAVAAGPPLAFVNVYLIDETTGSVLFQTQTDANGYFEFKSIPYKNYYFTINEPVIPPEPILLSFESNIFIKEVEVNGEVGTQGVTAEVTVTPNNNCDSTSADYAIWYLDYDGDGFGTSNFSVGQCTQPVGYVLNDLDCNDSDAGINPDAVDIPGSGIDANCDGIFTCDDPEIVEFISPAAPINSNEDFQLSAEVEVSNLESATWFWGDGTSSPGLLNGHVVSGNHFYLETGLYDVTLIVEDACGAVAESVYSYIVVINPCEGKIEGEGKISIVEELFRSNNHKAKGSTFEFEVEYEKEEGGFELEGEFSFKSKSEKFSIKSKMIDWLMVNNELAVFRGTGKTDERKSYNFLVAVIDGAKISKNTPDLFRLIVWDDDGTIIYDTQPGESQTTLPVTEISKGKIKIKEGCDEKEKKHKNYSIAENTFGTPVVSDLFNVVAYPNPTKGKVELWITNGNNAQISVIVSNLSGQKVFEKSYPENTHIQLDLRGNSPGIYFINTSANDQQIINRIILQNN